MLKTLLKSLLCWTVFCGSCAHAQSSTLIASGTEMINLAVHMELLRDPNGLMELDDVVHSDRWQTLTSNFNPGFTADTLWLRLRLAQPASEPTIWQLEIDNPNIDDIQLYHRAEGASWSAQRNGRNIAYADWPTAARVPTFPLLLAPGSHLVYLRIQSEHPVSAGILLWPVEAFQAHAQSEAAALGGYMGIVAAVIALQLFFWAMRYEGFSGWYFLYILTVASGALFGIGYPHNTFRIAPDVWRLLVGVYLCSIPFATAKLTTEWLDLKRNAPRAGRWYQFSIAGVAVFTSLTVILGNYRLGLQISQSFTLVWLLTALGLSLWLWQKRIAAAGFYLLIFGVVDVGIFTRYLKNLGVIPVCFFTSYAVLIAVILHLMLMSLYLIYRYNALQRALRIAEVAREEQRDFVSMVSHEFRTPLAIISTSIQQLASNLSAPVEKSAQRCLNIRNATLRMGRLLDDCLSLDRMDTSSRPLRLQKCRLFDVLEEVTSDWEMGRIRMKLHKLPHSWICDPDLMRVVLRNLLANADRHSPPETHVTLTAEGLQDGTLRITVHDTGCGIDADELPKLFQKYFRGRAAQSSPGAGLGLYLAFQVVKAHRGTISVQSSPGQGATFTLLFPAL